MSQVRRRFDVQVEPAIDQLLRDTKGTPKDVRAAFAHGYRDLLRRGCAAASYRLSGPGEFPRFCVLTLPRNWKLVMDFPSSAEVRLLVLLPHDRDSDPYRVLSELMGVERAPGLKDKPGCCGQGGEPPLPTTLGVLS